MKMHNPAHPALLIKDQMGERSVTEVAKHLRVTRATLSRIIKLSRIINGRAAVSADMALRLEDAFGVKADLWLRLQSQRDLWVASQKKRVKVARLELERAA
jgi:addiction module HigA family antidote